jgi:glutathione S-transferase
MAEYRLYGFGESGNCYKAALMLALTGRDWECIPVDYFSGETRGDAFRAATNEMGGCRSCCMAISPSRNRE